MSSRTRNSRDTGRPAWVDAPRPHDCPACFGFQYEQLTPGRMSVCRTCHGSGRDDVMGTRRPGLVVRDSQAPEVLRLLDMPRSATRHRRRLAVGPVHTEDTVPTRSPEGAERERERKRRAAADTRARAKRAAPQPTVPTTADPEPMPSLPDVATAAARRAHAVAARVERAGADLAGDEGTRGHQDVWRFEVELAHAIADLRSVTAALREWRSMRDAEVAAVVEGAP